ncbi:MAG: ORF6N domain-containing protein [Comamonas sp.]
MSNVVKINDTELRVIEHQSKRVVTLAEIDAVHARPEGTARRTFNEHKHRLVEGEDFYELDQPDVIRTLGIERPQGGTPSKIILITEQGYTMLVKPFTDDLAWQVQRQVVNGYFRTKEAARLPAKNQTKARALTRNQIANGILLLRSAAEDLKLAPSAVLGGYQRLEEAIGVAGLLPSYAVDAPTSAIGGSSERTKAAADLLKEFGVDMSVQAFNKLLMQHGLLEEHERTSSKGMKKFKVCVASEFGKNLTSPSNPRETQPHWYVSKFAELLDKVFPPKPA